MTRRFLATAALLFLATLTARAEETYDLKIRWKAVKGQKYALDSVESQKMAMKVLSGGQVVQEQGGEETLTFAGTVEVVAEKDGEPTELKVNLDKASHKKVAAGEEGEEADYGFAGQTVVAKKDGEEWSYAYENGEAVEEEDVKGLRKALNHNEKKGKKRPEEVFAPKQPVKVGESWQPDIADVVAGFGDGDESSFDLEKSSATFTLKSVAEKDGAKMGTIEGSIKLAATAFGPLSLAEPLEFEIKMTMEAVLDGSRPDGRMEANMAIKGERGASLPNGQQIDIDVDMTMQGKETKKLVK